MHDEIIRYGLEGVLPDTNIVQQRERLIQFIESKMRDHGCVPSIDLEPQFTLDYQPESETFKFFLSVYGIYVGDKSWEISGMTNGTTTLKYTPTSKSKAS